MKMSVNVCKIISALCLVAGFFAAAISLGSKGIDEIILATIMLFIGAICAAIAEASENSSNQ